MLNSIQILRAIAAWIVVFHHYQQVAYNFSLTDPLSVALHRYGAIGVDLFFVISGFVIFLSTTGKSPAPLEFAVHRLARIAPAYWIFSSITAVVLIYAPGVIPLTLFEPAFFVKSLLFLPTANPSGIGYFPIATVGWTLNYEMGFYCVFCASLFLPKKYRIASLFLGIIALRKVLPEFGGAFEFYKSKMVYEFLFGVTLGLLYRRGLFNAIKPWAAISLLALSLYLVFKSQQVEHDPWKAGIPCALILLSAVSQEHLMKKVKGLNALGNWSYSTYLCHIPIISVLVAVQNHYGLPPAVTVVGSVVLIVLVSALSYRVIERPIARFMKKNHSREPGSATLKTE
ncbi:acyltransferase family protein [Pseudomonas bharatica]|uniref:acyltransferase family protein n=1 Tax=Pseudomonas bharatica TaxID=2692112 RepID=UPI003B2854AC